MNYDFKLIEATVEKQWKKDDKKIKASLQFNPKKKLFSFLEGPPTANAPPALHHAEARLFKDIFPRYKFMCGFTVPRKGGWDCHGLPVEVQVEKKLNLGNKQAVIDFGIEKFNRICRDDVFSHIDEWNKFLKKLAHWIDLEKPYITMDNNYIESVWWSLKEIWKKKLLYEGFKVVPWCPHCETPLSSHEVAQGYKEITEDTVVVKFKLKDEDAYLLAWTTTPFTLPGNISIAVNPDIEYAYIKDEENTYILAKNLVEKYFVNPKIIRIVKGKELEGKKYEPLFNYVKNADKDIYVVLACDYVTLEDGTGIVHQASAYGEVDFEENKKRDLFFFNPILPDGTFSDLVPDLKGIFAKDADKMIIEKLKQENKLFKVVKHAHDYPFCWRCKTPLLYYATVSWFISMSKFRKELTELNEKINWYPGHIKEGRFGTWLSEIKDWALSRNKFWGTPLPIWKCECGNEDCIGSVEELKEKSVKKLSGTDLHKPFIDEVKIKCKCGKEMQRVPYVIDCWYDSGSASFAQFHYPFENKKMFEKRFPYDFIAEAIDQTRGWFYSMHAISTVLFGTNAYRNVVCAGHLVDEKGQKMSKSIGNIINPWDIFNKYGSDAARLLMCTSSPGSTKKIGFSTIEESVMPFLNTLWNICIFAKSSKTGKQLSKEDRWILSRVNSLVSEIEENLEKHEYHLCFDSFKKFVIDDFSRWYIKLTRDRNVKHVYDKIFLTLSRLLAPFVPYISDFIYIDYLKKKESVHLTSWPKPDKKVIDKKLEKNMNIIKQITETSNALRLEKKVKLKYILPAIIISGSDDVRKAVQSLKNILLKMANVKEIKFAELKEGDVEIKLNFAVAGKKYGKDVKEIAELLKNAKKVSDKITVGKFELDKEDIIAREIGGEGKSFEMGRVNLDLNITEELKQEWLLRELVRAVQEKRKNLNLKAGDKIKLYLPEEFKKFEKEISKTTNSKILFKEGGEKEEVEFEEKKVWFGIEK